MNKYYIYGLFDPRPDKHTNCFYVGQTKRGLTKRLYEHIICKTENRYKNNIINTILSLGLKPIIIEFECVDTKKECDNREIHYINECRKIGWNLTNVNKGGESYGTTTSVTALQACKQYSLHGEYITTYNSCANAARAIMNDSQEFINVYHSICKCCNGHNKSAFNYQWCKVGNESSILNDATIHNTPHQSLEVLSRVILKKISKRKQNIQYKIKIAHNKLPDVVETKRLKKIQQVMAYHKTCKGHKVKIQSNKGYQHTEVYRAKRKLYDKQRRSKECAII